MEEYNTLTDIELLTLLAKSDQNAFTAIYNRYWEKMFALAARKVDDLHDAEEIVQEIFVSLWNKRENLQITSSFNNYLAVSVKYRVIKTLARQQIHKRFENSEMNNISILDNSTMEYLDFDELKSKLEHYVSELPEKCRLVYQLSREAGFSQKQIAEKMSISEKTVEAHLSKAIKTLRIRLNKFMLVALL